MRWIDVNDGGGVEVIMFNRIGDNSLPACMFSAC